MIKKHRVAYIDENPEDSRKFQRHVAETLSVSVFLPKPDLDEFVEELINSGVDAYIVDFLLNEYRTAVKDPIPYNGSDLLEKILETRKGFPCFLLTSFDTDAIQVIGDVNYVYHKEIINPEKQLGGTTLAEKIRIQIEHYQKEIEVANNRFYELLNKSDKQDLSEIEENELLKLDTFLESTLNDHQALPIEKKNQLAVGRINELIISTNELINLLKSKNKK
jgi:hypothetical protein